MLEFVKKPPQIQIGHKSEPDSSNSETKITYPVCQACRFQIKSRWLYRLFGSEEPFHEDCCICSICLAQLTTSCYYRHGKLYCGADYHRIFTEQKCSVNHCEKCGQLIRMNEWVMRLENSLLYHLDCFTCSMCRNQLRTGDKFVLRGSQLLCHDDYENEQLINQPRNLHPAKDGCGVDRLTRRPRTTLTYAQRRQFIAWFDVNRKPCRKARERLATETGLNARVVQVWFQNQRAKLRTCHHNNNR